MTEKDLKKLTRKQLLELLLKQAETVEELQRQLSEAEERLKDRRMVEAESGSIAEAALRLNGIFEAADAAAFQYLENIRKLNESKVLMVRQIEEEARKKADEMIAETEKKCAMREELAGRRIREAAEQLHQSYKQHKMLDDVLTDYTGRAKEENTDEQ